jgi:hypothetical protein
LAKRGLQFNRANVRSATRRRGSKTKRLAASDRFTISIIQSKIFEARFELSPA